MKRLLTIVLAIMLIALTSCGKTSSKTTQPTTDEPSTTITTPSEDTNPTTDTKEEDSMKSLELKIDDTIVAVTWLDNDSVKALKEVAKDGLTINMNKYGGFEQVGSLGKTITSNDKRITTTPGDIVLYSSNQIVIFYGSNTWSYTKLGHINMTNNELTDLLGNEDVIIALTLK